jgi:hypothetical protein
LENDIRGDFNVIEGSPSAFIKSPATGFTAEYSIAEVRSALQRGKLVRVTVRAIP